MKAVLSRIREAAWAEPDPLLTEAGARGELLVSRVRMVLSSVLLLMPVVNLATGDSSTRETVVGFSATGAVFLTSLLGFVIARRGGYRPWIGIASACMDVTIVSLSLSSFLFVGTPHTAVNSKVIFEGYFLAFGLATLRYDRRVCVAAGTVALGQYLAIVIAATAAWDLNSSEFAPYPYGKFAWGAQISRLIVMAIASALSVLVVSRTQRLLRSSAGDPLTGLFNRGYFVERLDEEVARARRRVGASFVVAMIDVDRFKTFNDRRGHAEGDRVLKDLASVLRRSFRKSDVVARFGGDEFILAMPETDTAAAERKIDTVRQTVSAAPGNAQPLTISAGLASFPRDGATGESLIAVADARLLAAKDKGRNQTVSGSAFTPESRHFR